MAAAGALVVFSVEWLELHLKTDDPGGAVSVHAVAGLLGVVAVGASIQLLGVAVLIAIILPAAYVLNWVLNRVLPQRIPPEAEQHGARVLERVEAERQHRHRIGRARVVRGAARAGVERMHGPLFPSLRRARPTWHRCRNRRSTR